MKRWRVAEPDGTYWYASICPRCKRRSGWRVQAAAIRSEGWRQGVRFESYDVANSGDDWTCACEAALQ